MDRQTIIELALGLLEGNRCEPMLHDALWEYGMPKTAAHFLTSVNDLSSLALGDWTHRADPKLCSVAKYISGEAHYHISYFDHAPFYDELKAWEANK